MLKRSKRDTDFDWTHFQNRPFHSLLLCYLCYLLHTMKILIPALFVCFVTTAAKHSLKSFVTASTGVPNFPEFVLRLEIDNRELIYCNISKGIVEGRQDWIEKRLQEDSLYLEALRRSCFEEQPKLSRLSFADLKYISKSNEGAHILQAVTGCEVDENMEYSSSFFHLGFDGEDFMTLDINRLAWIPQKSQAIPVKNVWNQDKEGLKLVVNIFTTECPVWLRGSVEASNMSYQNSVLPTVSLLQKSPSSPVSCHATGFYPERAVLFWRREEEEIHEGVEHGEILQNNDGTFQMTVELNVSVIPLKDWRKYDCVFQLYGVSGDIVTPLNKGAIRTNWEHSSNVVVPITASLLFVLIIAITAYIAFKKKKDRFAPIYDDNSTGLI